MQALLSFLICLVIVVVATVRFKAPPFVSLFGASLLFGLLAGMGAENVVDISLGGAGRLFSILGVVVFSGVLISRCLAEGRLIDTLVNDIRRVARDPVATGAVGGYILSVPLMCCITNFIVSSPIVTRLAEGARSQRTVGYAIAVASVVSYVLVYPSPAVVIMLENLSVTDPWGIDMITIPLSLALLSVIYIWFRRRGVEPASEPSPGGPRSKAWGSIMAPFVLIGIGTVIPGLEPLADLSVALFLSMLVAFAMIGQAERQRAVMAGTRSAGVIIFDLCGAGAFGAVIAASGFPAEISDLLQSGNMLPVVLVPFILTALVQAAQGSRLVSVTVASTIEASVPELAAINPWGLVLLIGGGAMTLSIVSDPYFWVISRYLNDDVGGVLRGYTLPLTVVGLITALIGALLAFF